MFVFECAGSLFCVACKYKPVPCDGNVTYMNIGYGKNNLKKFIPPEISLP